MTEEQYSATAEQAEDPQGFGGRGGGLGTGADVTAARALGHLQAHGSLDPWVPGGR